MSDAQTLTLAFAGNHPAEAARVIETLPVAEAAALFAAIPARIGHRVLGAMLTTAAARMLGALPDDQVLALLTAAGTQTAVTLLRHIPDPRRTRLIGGLPTVSALASRMLLAFPEDAVGAWCDPAVVVLAPATSAAEALQRVRAGEEQGIDRILVVDPQRKLVGDVPLDALLHAADRTTVGALMHPPATTLSAMMPVAAASTLRAWEQSSTLPVIDRDERLIGVLRRSTLARAIHERSRQLQADTARSVAGVVAGGYWNVIAGLAGASLALLPTVGRIAPEDE